MNILLFKQKYPNYEVTPNGIVYKDGKEMKPFKSNKYFQVLLYDVDHHRHIFGVHTLVAMLYLDNFYSGCVVHHKDGDPHNNNVDNLAVLSQSEHAKLHTKDYYSLAEYVKKNGPHNKGKKMSKEFCDKCSESAKRRWERVRKEKLNTED